MACSYSGLTLSDEIRPDASCRIASTSSGGLGMLPIGSVGIGMRAILPPSRQLSNVSSEHRRAKGLEPTYGTTGSAMCDGKVGEQYTRLFAVAKFADVAA